MRQQDITYEDKLNELRQEYAHPNNQGKVFILVEGESDIRLFRDLFHRHCKIENIPGGNSKIKSAVEYLKILQHPPLVIGIQDADFIHLSYQDTAIAEAVFLTDYHDMEMMMIASDQCFHKVIYQYTEVQADEQLSLVRRNIIFQVLMDISFLKWLNYQEGLRLNFTDVSIVGFIKCRDSHLSFDLDDYVVSLLKRSPDANVASDYLFSRINDLKASYATISPFLLCNGHDFMDVFAAYLRCISPQKGISKDILEKGFKMAYHKEHFITSKLYLQTQKWAEQNNCLLY